MSWTPPVHWRLRSEHFAERIDGVILEPALSDGSEPRSAFQSPTAPVPYMLDLLPARQRRHFEVAQRVIKEITLADAIEFVDREYPLPAWWLSFLPGAP